MVTTLRSLYSVLLTALPLCGVAGVAEAIPIPAGSSINFTGQSTCTSTSCTFGDTRVSSGTGAFASFTLGMPATFFPYTFDPFTPQQVYSTTNASGQTASFVTTAQLSRSTPSTGTLTAFTVFDAGIASLTGYDDTPGNYVFTANQDGAILGSFSATSNVLAAAVPEPGSWAMMILGFGVMGGVMRRRRAVTTRVSFR